jgi:Peptidase family M1 domain
MRNLRSAAFSLAAALFVFASAVFAQAPAPVRPQAPVEAPRAPAFRAVSYDVHASVWPDQQTLSAQATVEFESGALSNEILCELHPNLRINSVKDAAGKAVDFERDFNNSLLVRLTLPNGIPPGQRIKLTFDYSGQLPNEQNASPIAGMRVAWVGNQGAYLLLPGRWFPLTGFPSNRYTGVFRIDVPDGFVVAGTGVPEGTSVAPPSGMPLSSGTAGGGDRPVLIRNRNPNLPPPPEPAPSPDTAAPPAPAAPPRTLYTFRVDRPQAAGTFVAGKLQQSPVQAQGLSINVFSPAASADTAQDYGNAVAGIVEAFSDEFGPLPQPNLTLAQIPDGTVSAYAAPGVLLVSQRHWAARPDTQMLANLVASQWWGDQVMAASPNDVWITDGLARYSEALYIEQTANHDALSHALEDYAVGALMYEDAAPISQAGRLVPLSTEYTSVVVNKGAMVFHMLRARLGDAAFSSLLRDFYSQYSGKQATVLDFEKLAEQHAPSPQQSQAPQDFAIRVNAAPSAESTEAAASLQPFFAQWVNSTGVPEFTLDYTVYRTPKGFRIVGKIKQPLPVFHSTLELQVQTEGNPETKEVDVDGTESNFDVETFGRPKPGGVTLDPHDYILKSSPRLHIRAIIARGEALAEQSKFYDALQQYGQALDLQKNQSLAQFRMGEVFFYQKNYQAAANSFRGALDGDMDPQDKWVEVWSHIYLGKIFDISGDRTRAVNEYSRAQQTNDDTGGAQEEVKKYIASPYKEIPG